MKGFQVVLFKDATLDPKFKRPVGTTEIRKWWFATRSAAESALSQVQQEHDGVAELRA